MRRVYKESYLKRKVHGISDIPAYLRENLRLVLAVAAALLCLLFLVSCLLTHNSSRLWPAQTVTSKQFSAPEGSAAGAPGLWASAAVLVDAESGRVLFEKNAHVKLPMASTTKMMTALVVRDQLELSDQVVVTPEAAAVGEQEIWLEPGETLSVEELLWALLVQSANDAAHALAQYTTGSIESFAELMNEKAQAIGAMESHFTNPHGLDQPGHYSSAYDLAVIGRELLNDPVLEEMVAEPSHEIPWPGHPYPRTCVNHNEILNRYQGADGIKTGYTEGAGRCLVASADRGDKGLVAAVLNSEHREDDASALFDYGFDNTARLVLAAAGEDLGRCRVSTYPRRYVDVVPAKELAALTIIGSQDIFTLEASIPAEVEAPVMRGQALGRVECTLNQNPLYIEGAVAERSAPGSDALTSLMVFMWYSLCWAGKIISAPFRIF